MPHGDTLQVLGVAGSLRKASFNAAILRAAGRLAPDNVRIETFDLAPIPLYNEDVRQAGFPPAVADLRARIATADAVLIVTPEYNYSMPGVLKNAIDWASRPPEQPFDAKPVGIMGASPSRLGSARAQYHLRQSFVFLNALVMNKPEVMIARVNELLDEDGQLADEATAGFIREHLAALAEWTRKQRREAG